MLNNSLAIRIIAYCVPVMPEKCSLCYDRTKSLPGYAADPNNCAKYYQCVRYGSTWSAFSMDCPICTFWDQDKLTCVEVYSGPECGNSTHETGTWAFTTPSASLFRYWKYIVLSLTMFILTSNCWLIRYMTPNCTQRTFLLSNRENFIRLSKYHLSDS